MVKKTIAKMLRRTKGNLLTITTTKIIREMDLPRTRLIIYIISYILEELSKEGLIELYKATKRGKFYLVCRDFFSNYL